MWEFWSLVWPAIPLLVIGCRTVEIGLGGGHIVQQPRDVPAQAGMFRMVSPLRLWPMVEFMV